MRYNERALRDKARGGKAKIKKFKKDIDIKKVMMYH